MGQKWPPFLTHKNCLSKASQTPFQTPKTTEDPSNTPSNHPKFVGQKWPPFLTHKNCLSKASQTPFQTPKTPEDPSSTPSNHPKFVGQKWPPFLTHKNCLSKASQTPFQTPKAFKFVGQQWPVIHEVEPSHYRCELLTKSPDPQITSGADIQRTAQVQTWVYTSTQLRRRCGVGNRWLIIIQDVGRGVITLQLLS